MKISALLEELNLFPGREEGLRSVKRYSLYQTIFYRTDLWTHSRRVAWIVEELIPLALEVFGESFDSEKALALALVHDDAEIIFGDIQAGNKVKMSKKELEDIEQRERFAIEDLVKKSPSHLGRYLYRDLLIEAIEKRSLEYILVDWADKYDAYCEALHELYAGNISLTVHIENEYGKIDLPTEYYLNYFNSFQRKFPQSKALFDKKNPWFVVPPPPQSNIAEQGVRHSESSSKIKKGYHFYDQWIALTLEKGDQKDRENLYIPKEE